MPRRVAVGGAVGRARERLRPLLTIAGHDSLELATRQGLVKPFLEMASPKGLPMYSPHATAAMQAPWFDGNAVILPRHGSVLPGWCVVCGMPAAGSTHRHILWHPEEVFAALAFVPALYPLLALATLKRASLSFSVCESHATQFARGRAAFFGGAVGLVACVVLVLVGVVSMVTSFGSAREPLYELLFLGLALPCPAVLAMLIGRNHSKIGGVRRIDDQTLQIVFRHPFQERLWAWANAQRRW